MFITAILEIVYCNGNKKSPRARSLNYAGNEYEIEYVFFELIEINKNYYFFKVLILQMMINNRHLMVTIDCFWYNRGVYLLDGIGHRIQSRCINEERK